MRAGKLRHYVSIQRPVNVEQEDGSREQQWVEERALYADIMPLNGKMLVAMQQIQSEVTVSIIIRGSYVPAADRRVVHAGKFYNIHSVIDKDARGIEVQLLCSEGTNDG